MFVSYCRDAVNEMALHFLSKMKILVVRDIEREDIEFISKVCLLVLCVHSCAHPRVCVFVHVCVYLFMHAACEFLYACIWGKYVLWLRPYKSFVIEALSDAGKQDMMFTICASECMFLLC
jgi:hypothetical protein